MTSKEILNEAEKQYQVAEDFQSEALIAIIRLLTDIAESLQAVANRASQ